MIQTRVRSRTPDGLWRPTSFDVATTGGGWFCITAQLSSPRSLIVTDTVTLRGLRVRGHHGVLPEERRDGQLFVVDAVLHVDTVAAARSDDLAHTVDYAELADQLVAVVGG